MPNPGPPTFLAFAVLIAVSCHAQGKPAPPVLISQTAVVLDSVITDQWPALSAVVTLPEEPTVLNPGQCVRVGVAASGIGSQQFVDGIGIRAVIKTGDTHDEFQLEPSSSSKSVRADSDGMVADILTAAHTPGPQPIAALAVSRSKWCVPPEAADGKATFLAEVDLHGQQAKLKPITIRIESLATGAAADFKDKQQLGEWTMSYDRHPEPARLLAAVRFLAVQEQPDLNGIQFLISAFSHDRATASQFGHAVSQLGPRPRLLAIAIAAKAKVTFAHPPSIQPEDGKPLDLSGFPDPYDLNSSPQPWQNLDLLWADFLATGNRMPVAAIAGTLAWKSDYDAFLKSKADGKKITQLDPPLVRALTYHAAQWSLSSFYKNDPIAADYIRSLRDDPSTPQTVRDELRNLSSAGAASSGN